VFTLDYATSGSALLAAAGGEKKLKLRSIGARVMTPLPGAKRPSSFTSLGPGFNLEMKPDIAALLTQHKGKMSVDDARGALMSTAAPVEASSRLYGNYTAPFARVGAGGVQVHAALVNPTRVSPYRLRLASGPAPQQHVVTLTNAGGRDVTYTLSHRAAAAVVLFEVGAALAAEALLYSGYIRIIPEGPFVDAEGAPLNPNDVPPPLSLPYQGFSGDYDAAGALAPVRPEYPSSEVLNGTVGGLYLGCIDFTGQPCDPPGRGRDDALNATSRLLSFAKVYVATGKPVMAITIQAFNGTVALIASSTLSNPLRDGAFSLPVPPGLPVNNTQPYTFKVLVKPAGDGPLGAAAPLQTFDVRGGLYVT
ncbi:MAG: hypothetical protein J3K34DRAFT_392445, partial [Monoraphidium minutum]